MSLPPLVAPAAELSPDEVRRYSRHVLLPQVGLVGQRRLKNARVLVIGAGGLGSPALMYLAAAGVGTLGILDDDTVDQSNLQRQVVHSTADDGRPKVDSAAETVTGINPHVRVVRHPVRLTATNALEVFRGYDLVLDGTDTFGTRYLIGDACELLGLPWIWGSIYRFDGQVSLFWTRPPAVDAEGAAVAPVTYRDVFPDPPSPGLVPSCAEGGVLGVLCAAIGSVMSTEAVKLVCGIGEPLLGRLLVFDALAMTWRTVRVRPMPGRAAVTALPADAPVREALPDRDTITAVALADLLAARARGQADALLVDVREPGERDIVAIDGSVSVPIDRFRSGDATADLVALGAGPGGRRVVLHCKSGARSAEALTILRTAGFPNTVHLAGGVLAWIDQVDPALPRY